MQQAKVMLEVRLGCGIGYVGVLYRVRLMKGIGLS
jgi:hypothetical protein